MWVVEYSARSQVQIWPGRWRLLGCDPPSEKLFVHFDWGPGPRPSATKYLLRPTRFQAPCYVRKTQQ